VNILFLCTGNSCRSQMAEGWGRHLSGEHTFRSAGIEAHGKNPRAITVMSEAGIDISGQSSTQLTDEMLGWADLVVTVCGHADDNCPVLPAGVRKLHWPLDDPAKAGGDEATVMQVFRDSRDEIRRRLLALLDTLTNPSL
jgi:arsenate reductase